MFNIIETAKLVTVVTILEGLANSRIKDYCSFSTNNPSLGIVSLVVHFLNWDILKNEGQVFGAI